MLFFKYVLMFVRGLWQGDCRRLHAGPFMLLMRVVDNGLGSNRGAAFGQWLTALTALQKLDLSCEAPCFAVLCGVCFNAREGVATRVGCVWSLLYRRCVLQGTFSRTMVVLLWVNH